MTLQRISKTDGATANVLELPEQLSLEVEARRTIVIREVMAYECARDLGSSGNVDTDDGHGASVVQDTMLRVRSLPLHGRRQSLTPFLLETDRTVLVKSSPSIGFQFAYQQ